MKSPAFLLFALALAPALPGGEPSVTDNVPCRVHRNTTGHFPLRLQHQGVLYGTCSIVLEVGLTGTVDDLLVTTYSHPEFASEVLRTVKGWTFEPGRNNGQPVISVVTIDFEFTVNGMSVYERHPDSMRIDDYLAKKYAYYPQSIDALDRKPTPVVSKAPVYPQTWMAQGHRGAVTVTFYIDETGKPRMPIANNGADPLLAGSAIAAVKDWRFSPPQVRGKSALVQAEQVFVFEPAVTDSRM